MTKFSTPQRVTAAATVLGGSLWVGGQPASAATFTVTTLADVVDPDDGELSLREAVLAANLSLNTPDVITFDPSVNGLIGLTSQLKITDDVAILADPGTVRLEGYSSVLYVYNDAAITVSGLSISSFAHSGIRVGGESDISLADVTLSFSGQAGLSFDAAGDVSITRSTFESNGTFGVTGASAGTVTVTDSVITGHTNAGFAISNVSSLSVSGATVDDNSNDGVTLDSVGGNVVVADSAFTGNGDTGFELGAATGSVSVTRSTFDENEGGLYVGTVDGDLVLDTVTASTNSITGVSLKDGVVGVATLTDVTAEENGDLGFYIDDFAGDLVMNTITANRNGSDGVQITQSAGDVSITGLGANANGADGLYIYDIDGDVTVADAVARANGDEGLNVEDVTGSLTITEAVASANGRDGVYVDDIVGAVTISAVVADLNTDNGIAAEEMEASLTLSEVSASDNGASGVNLDADENTVVTIDRVEASRNQEHGVVLGVAAAPTTITGVTADDNGRTGFDTLGHTGRLEIADSSFSGNDVGIYIGYNENEVDISDTVVSSSTRGGVSLGTPTRFELIDVEIADSGEAGLASRGQYGAGTLERVTLADNAGGAIEMLDTPKLTILNSTIAGNGEFETGGVITLDNTPMTVQHSTISGNTIEPGSGAIFSPLSYVTIDHSIVSGNTGGEAFVPTVGRLLATVTNSLLPDNADDPLLGPLADNGGPTRTMLPLPDSPAIDAGDPILADVPTLPTDQRGGDRVVDVIDIGAVEVQAEVGDVVTSTAPARFVDTRSTGETLDQGNEAEGKRAADSEYRVTIAGRGTVPLDAKAVVMNITAVGAEDVGFFTVHPCREERPLASSLNYTPGVNLANEIVAPLSDDGEVCIYTSEAAHVLVDVVGFVEANSPVVPVTPARYLDTRPTGRTSAEGEMTLRVAGRGDVPAGAAAVIVNVTAVNPSDTGFVTVHQCLDTPPNASSLNYVAGVNRANELIASLSEDGEICLFTSTATDLLVDVVGYLPAATSFQPIAPSRFLDTRPTGRTVDGAARSEGKREADDRYILQVAGRPGVPVEARAVVVNVTAASPEGTGFVTVDPCLATVPNASSLNHVDGVNGANELIALLDEDGRLCLFNDQPTHLIVDVVAYLD